MIIIHIFHKAFSVELELTLTAFWKVTTCDKKYFSRSFGELGYFVMKYFIKN